MTTLTSALAGLDDRGAADGIGEILGVARRHLGMDVAFISEFVGAHRIFRYVDPLENAAALRVGNAMALDDGYCKRIIDGLLPELMPDTGAVPLARTLPATRAVPIGAHVGVAVRLANQDVYGSFCCLSHAPDRSLTQRDLQVMRVLADLASQQIERLRVAEQRRGEEIARITGAIRGEGFASVFQPIFSLATDRIVGVESLARFTAPPVRPPDRWFADADRVGLRIDLECAALRAAFTSLPLLPFDVYLAVNVSPATILHEDFPALFVDVAIDRLVLEITEHVDVEDYDVLATRIAPLRGAGLRIAVDDAGAGYASLQHILNLRPDIIKLDMSLTRNVDTDPARRALAAALVRFAGDIGCALVAEGVETPAELAALRAFGVTVAQGFGLCHPLPLADLLARIHAQEVTSSVLVG